MRSRRRSIGLEVGSSGLTIRAPLRVSVAQIESALQDKAQWVLDKLAASALRVQQTP